MDRLFKENEGRRSKWSLTLLTNVQITKYQLKVVLNIKVNIGQCLILERLEKWVNIMCCLRYNCDYFLGCPWCPFSLWYLTIVAMQHHFLLIRLLGSAPALPFVSIFHPTFRITSWASWTSRLMFSIMNGWYFLSFYDGPIRRIDVCGLLLEEGVVITIFTVAILIIRYNVDLWRFRDVSIFWQFRDRPLLIFSYRCRDAFYRIFVFPLSIFPRFLCVYLHRQSVDVFLSVPFDKFAVSSSFNPTSSFETTIVISS